MVSEDVQAEFILLKCVCTSTEEARSRTGAAGAAGAGATCVLLSVACHAINPEYAVISMHLVGFSSTPPVKHRILRSAWALMTLFDSVRQPLVRVLQVHTGVIECTSKWAEFMVALSLEIGIK